MQRQTLLVSAAVFALLACAAWFLLPREPASGTRAPLVQLPSPSPAQSAPPAVPATAMPEPAPALPPPAPVAAAPRPPSMATPAQADAAKDGADETPVDPAPAVAPDDAAPRDAAPAHPATAEEIAGTSPSADAPAGAADAGSRPGEDAHGAQSPATKPDPHDERAADLFAQRIEALDDPHGNDAQDARAVAAQQAYEAHDEGGDGAKATQAIVHDVFANWLANLHMDNSHPSLISIDCRSGACRVLIAQAGVDFTGAAQLERESPVNVFSRALTDFSQGAAWSDAGLALQDSQMAAAGGTAEKANDIALWTIYLRVAAAE